VLEAAWVRQSKSVIPRRGNSLELGLRGKNDQPFWVDDPGRTRRRCGPCQGYSCRIDKQIDIATKATPQAEFFTSSWARRTTQIDEAPEKNTEGVTLDLGLIAGTWIIQDNGRLDLQVRCVNTKARIKQSYSEMIAATDSNDRWKCCQKLAHPVVLLNVSNVRPWS